MCDTERAIIDENPIALARPDPVLLNSIVVFHITENRALFESMTIRQLPCVWLVLVQLPGAWAQGGLSPAVPGIDGNFGTEIPFSGPVVPNLPPMRYQQVYDASAFSSSIPQGGWITGIWFVSDSEYGWSASLPKVELMMGTTGREPDNLSLTFAENFSSVPVVVRPEGVLSITAGGRGDVVMIDFPNPFFYDPDAGNLLLEVKNYLPTLNPGSLIANPGALDAWNVPGDSVSRVYARGNANATVGTADTVGLTTFFLFVSVPEPSTMALLTLGLGGLGLRWCRRGRPQSKTSKNIS